MYCRCHNCHTSFVHQCLAPGLGRPSGTSIRSPTFPALKRWAKLVRPSGAPLPVSSLLLATYFSSCELLLLAFGFNLLRRRLHDVVSNRTLHTVLIGVVVHHGML